jgi:hypothetical protein
MQYARENIMEYHRKTVPSHNSITESTDCKMRHPDINERIKEWEYRTKISVVYLSKLLITHS